MADDLSWIDHPANIRANAALLRIVADQSLLHAAELERLRGRLLTEHNMVDEIEQLRETCVKQGELIDRLHDEIARLRGLLREARPYIEGAQNTTDLEAHQAAAKLLEQLQ